MLTKRKKHKSVSQGSVSFGRSAKTCEHSKNIPVCVCAVHIYVWVRMHTAQRRTSGVRFMLSIPMRPCVSLKLEGGWG